MLPIQFSRPDRSTGHALRVECIDDAHDFARLGERWNGLLQESSADGIFLTWEWLHAWWTHLRGDRALHIVLVWDGDALVGIAPLVRSRPSLPWLSQFEFLGTGFAGSDYLDLIVHGDRRREVTDALVAALVSAKRVLHLDHLPPASVVESAMVVGVADAGWTTLETASGTCPFIPLAGHSWDSYLASLGAAHRANLRRRMRALDRQFAMQFVRISTESQRTVALDTLMTLHNKRWDVRGGSTAFASPACRAFHDDVTRRMLERGWLRLYELRLNDTVVAATYCFAYGGRVSFYQGAFDDRYQQHSVGMVAMGLTIRAAIEEGAREFDMLYGVESYKWLWARQARSLHRVELFPPDIAGRLHHGTVRAERTVRTLARRIFPRRSCISNVPPAGVAC